MNKKIQVLDQAYKNDFVDSQDFPESYLDSLVKQGLLENKHKHHRVNRQVYQISEKGIKLLESN